MFVKRAPGSLGAADGREVWGIGRDGSARQTVLARGIALQARSGTGTDAERSIGEVPRRSIRGEDPARTARFAAFMKIPG
jgi:hypothetical protein